MNRTEVWRLLGIADPATIRAQAAFQSPASPWRGVRLSRVSLIAADARCTPCLFLTPPTEPPWRAGAIAVHQHNNEFHLGKSEPAGRAGNPGLAYGLALARLGLPTLIPDLSGFEERRGAFHSDADFEQSHAWHLATLGKSLQGAHLEDLAMATAWLSENPEITGDLGIVGHSLGGQTAFFALAADRRLRAGVISCGIGTIGSFEAMHVLHNPAWYLPGLAAAGDVPAVAAAIRDQPVFAIAGRNDSLFPFWGVQEVVRAMSGAPVDFRAWDGGHEFPPALQEESLRWLRDTLNP